MARSAEHFCYEFGDYRLDPERRVICSAATSERLGIPPRIVDIAWYFVQRPGELVSKESLMSGIWPGQVVEDNNLTQGISQLRRAFGERRGENRYIVTVARRGYRFVADVIRRENGSPHIGLPDRTIAVLPLACLGDDPADVALADGVTATIRHALARLAGFGVVVRAPATACDGVVRDVHDTGRQLNARYLVTGTCRHSHSRIRITVQLIDAEESVYVWSQLFDCNTWDHFDIEDDVARAVVRAVATATDSAAGAGGSQGERVGRRKPLSSAASVAGSRP